MIQQTSICSKIINENSWTPTKIKLWPCKKWSTYNFSLAYRSLLLDIQIHSLCIPSCYSIRFHQYIHTPFALLLGRYDVDPRQLLFDIQTLLKFWQILVMKVASIYVIEWVFALTSHFRCNSKYLVRKGAEIHVGAESPNMPVHNTIF